MLNTGILVALIPEMKGVVNLIQYDEYHIYPVDKHLLQAVQLLKDFGKPELPSQDLFYGQLFKVPGFILWPTLQGT
jgi:[protein-PII] uridylyltransferase